MDKHKHYTLPFKFNKTLDEFVPPSEHSSLVPFKALLDKLAVTIEVDTPPEIIVGPVLNGLNPKGNTSASFVE